MIILHPQDNILKFNRHSRTCVVWPAASTCSVTVGAWQQCGGTSNCASGVTCTDAQWYVNLKTTSICRTPFPVQSRRLSTPSACNIHACITNKSLLGLSPFGRPSGQNIQADHGCRLKGCLPLNCLKHKVDAWQGQHLLWRTLRIGLNLCMTSSGLLPQKTILMTGERHRLCFSLLSCA